MFAHPIVWQFIVFITQLDKLLNFGSITEQSIDMFWKSIDTDGSGFIDEYELLQYFLNIIDSVDAAAKKK